MVTEAQKTVWDAQVEHADAAYMTGATGTDVQDDLDARVTAAADSYTDFSNSDFGDLDTVGGSQDPDQLVDVVPDNPTEFDTLVKNAADAGDLFAKGGPTDNYTDSSDLTDDVDGLFLAERSKQTGKKFF